MPLEPQTDARPAPPAPQSMDTSRQLALPFTTVILPIQPAPSDAPASVSIDTEDQPVEPSTTVTTVILPIQPAPSTSASLETSAQPNTTGILPIQTGPQVEGSRRRKRGPSRTSTQKELTLKFFVEEDSSRLHFRCKLCNQIISAVGDRSFGNLSKHLQGTNNHVTRVDGKSISEHWANILEKRTSQTKDQMNAMIDKLFERQRLTDTRDVRQQKMNRFLQTDQVTLPESECTIKEDCIHLSDLEYNVFMMLGNVLRNQSFMALDDAYENIFRKIVFLQNARSTDMFAQEQPRTYRPAPSPESRTSNVTKYLTILESAAIATIREDLQTVTVGSALTDGWSSRPGNSMHRFTGLCISYVQWTDMTFKTQLLHFEVHNSGHTSQNLSETYLTSLEKFLPKNFLLGNQTTDNANNERHAAELVLQKKGFWQDVESCMAHTLQLDLNEFLTQERFHMILKPILKVNTWLLNNLSTKKEFIDYQKAKTLEVYVPASFVKTRWWSTIPAISFFVRRYSALLDFITIKEPNFFQNLNAPTPSFSESSELLTFLNHLKIYSDKLSVESKVTSTRVIPIIYRIDNLTFLAQQVHSPDYDNCSSE